MQQMASFDTNEFVPQCKTCRCGEGDANIWTRTSENPDKQLQKCSNCQVLKSGPLLLSSKGIGWTSWKKRWFVLTRTSLVFYRSDPNAPPPKGSEPNVSLGGIDLNNSGSVVVKADKKLLTVLFPDGRDGRNFTLKTETLEDLFEWKTALENALAESPSPALLKGQSAISRNETTDTVDAASEKSKDKRPVKSLVIGRPILLALEDIDGSPSFLEKALRYIEDYGIKVEGILRQSADVEEVERRVREYEQGKNEFSGDEDGHVIGDCIKYVLRELPSSPVPATCCTALVDAYRADRGSRINAMRAAITETFPEPNRRLVQRILKMMLKVASHKTENRMSLSALAACMAPLLLRPLLAGDCELEDDFNMGGDGSIQLLQAAAAANHAQAIVIILLEEYDRIFDEDFVQEGSSDVYSESEGSDVEDESTDNDALEDDESNDGDNGLQDDRDDRECSSSGTLSECDSDGGSDSYDNQASEDQNSESSSHVYSDDIEGTETPSNTSHAPVRSQTLNDLPAHEHSHSSPGLNRKVHASSDVHASKISSVKSSGSTSSSKKHTGKSNNKLSSIKRRTFWGRTSARKNLPMESVGYSNEDENTIKQLELKKGHLQAKMTEEVKGNAELQKNLKKRKEELCERRLALEQEVQRLREELKKERDLRAILEAGLKNSQPGKLAITSCVDNKTRADLEEITRAEADIINLKQKVADLQGQLSHQLYASLCNSCRHLYATHQLTEKEQQKNVGDITHQNENPSRRETSGLGANAENVQLSATNQSTRPTEESTTYGHNTASKHTRIYSFEETVRTVTARSSIGTEETGTSTSNALAKLTNRLKFLKERRVQLVNELQNLDAANRMSDPDGPPLNTDPR